MILLDANLLLYAYDSASEHHESSVNWLEKVLSGPDPVRFAWVTILAFLRISTNFRALKRPLAIGDAVSVVSEWLGQPAVALLEPGERHWGILSALLPRSQSQGDLVMDAHLAALAIEHGATVCTNDRDFLRFPNLRLLNPLETE